MTKIELLLVQLSEECAEVSQRACKALRFGLIEKQEGQEHNNEDRLFHEVCDLIGVLEVLSNENIMCGRSEEGMKRVNAKVNKIQEMLKYSYELGILNETK